MRPILTVIELRYEAYTYCHRAAVWRPILTVIELWYGGVVLELVEGALQHVLGVDLLHTQQVQHHVVRQVERRVQRVRLALHNKHTHRVRYIIIQIINNKHTALQNWECCKDNSL